MAFGYLMIFYLLPHVNYMKLKIVLLLVILCQITTEAQVKKSVDALRIETPLVIDGALSEEVYNQVKPAKDFVQLQPYNGRPSLQPTEAWFFFDHNALYVGAMLYDSAPDSIFNYLSERDNIGVSDYFGVYFDPYNQGQLAYGFFITPSGVQIDIKAVKSDDDNEDGNWNAVWESKTQITDRGWVVEMRIPYSALRFSEKAGTTWGLNMFRNIRRHSSNNSWNFLDRKVSGFIHQQGELKGIKGINSPVRLSFSPYSAVYYEKKSEGSSEFLYRGGMDVKYGITESFTLDMMLVPDFGQVQSDDKQLNLSPYELYYDENRQFFNEGTELFQRADIFYSRRIGARPKFPARSHIQENEEVHFNPTETRLANATKVSGRTNNGWGLGVLNAMSVPSYGEVIDTITRVKREVLVQPFTNYNISVIDKSLKNNSYISLINSNMSMANNPFSANVTATEFQLRDKSKTYAVIGKGGVSNRGGAEIESGYFVDIEAERNKGQLQYGIEQTLISDKYNPNDLGFLRRNNRVDTEMYIHYQVVEPVGIFREYNFTYWFEHNRIYNPNVLSANEMGLNSNFTLKNNYYININGSVSSDRNDYYEPRVKGRFVKYTPEYSYNLNLNTDSRKRINAYFHYGHAGQPEIGTYADYGTVNIRWRIGYRFQTSYRFSYNITKNQIGFAKTKNDNNDIYFAERDVNKTDNIWSSSYVINNKANINLRVRHHWTGSENKSFYLLQKDGTLLPEPSFSDNVDQNFNAFNVDMAFRWIFAPGSELVCAWKNAAYSEDALVVRNFWDNLRDTWLNQSNSFSVKVLYYFDYNNLSKREG